MTRIQFAMSVGGVALLLVGLVGGEWLYDALADRRQRQQATEAFECERDVQQMRGKASDYRRCLKAMGWTDADADLAARQYFLDHMSAER
jgi:hypothetical protein